MELLFQKYELSSVIRSYLQNGLPDDVQRIPENTLLSVSEHELVDQLVEKYLLAVPVIHSDQAYISSQGETTFSRQGHGGSVKFPAHFVEISIPFSGDRDLFYFRGNSWDTGPPRAELRAQEVALNITDRELSRDAIEKRRDDLISKLERYLGYLRGDCDRWNAEIAGHATRLISDRKAKLVQKNDVLESLGMPIGKRANPSGSVAIPIRRKRIELSRQTSNLTKPFKPEPAISDEVFDGILEVIDRLSINIERSPTTFSTMGEEAIRDLILVNLNGHFEGKATSETFNSGGKTDILIREGDRNVFIAECKFWKGPKSLTSAIDQLLGYLTWRDTKAALVVFSRNTDMSNILDQVERVVASHQNFRKLLGKKHETHFRFVLQQKDDSHRDIYLAVLVFDIPGEK